MTNDHDFGWLNDEPALCVSIVRGSAHDAVRKGFAASGDIEFATLELAARWSMNEGALWFATGDVGEFVFVWEDNGWRGSSRDLAATFSETGSFASMYWNVNALSAFTFARGGAIVAQFESLWAPNASTWPQLLEFGATHVSDDDWFSAPWASGLALQSQLLGTSMIAHPSWLTLPGVRFWGSPSFLS